jgi:RNA polymerase sigma-70 factor, ECF subfamily
MDEKKFLAEQFQANAPHLRSVAYRMLGSFSDAEDAVQEAWIRLDRTDAGAVENLRAWLTTVVARVSLDMLRMRKSRREDEFDVAASELGILADGDLEQEVALADTVGLALMILLQSLSPTERVVFVLHDMFDLPFDDIAPIVGRSSDAARQLASRARRRIRAPQAAIQGDLTRRQQVLEAFLAAARSGDLAGLIAVLDPEVSFSADKAAVDLGGPPELRGADVVAKHFAGRAQAAQVALVDGQLGLAVVVAGRLLLVLKILIEDERIAFIEALADSERLRGAEINIGPGPANSRSNPS